MTRPRKIGLHDSVLRFAEAVEKHSFNPGMIMKKLHVNRSRHRTADMKMHTRAAVRRERNIRRPAKRGHIEKSADAPATRCISLQNGHGFGIDHPAEIPGGVAVFSGGDVHADGRARPHFAAGPARLSELTGSSSHRTPLLCEIVREAKRLRDCVSPVGVNKKLAVYLRWRCARLQPAADRLSGLRSHFHLHHARSPAAAQPPSWSRVARRRRR